MKRVFIDCGSNLGQGLHRLCRDLSVNNEWEIHCFEVNPKTFEILKTNVQNNNWLTNYCSNVHLHNQAVWVKNELKQLTLEYCPFEKGWIGGATNIMEQNYNRPPGVQEWQIKDAEEKVECIDFAEFVKNNFTKDDYIVCKMDIEASEYEVIEHLHNNNVLNYFNTLYVEWHNWILHNQYQEDNVKSLIQQNNVELRGW
jgi:FkbM family methyltransferase